MDSGLRQTLSRLLGVVARRVYPGIRPTKPIDPTDVQAETRVATVVQLFPREGFGFLRAINDGHEIYFHRTSVTDSEFETVSVGARVRYVETIGRLGAQAVTVTVTGRATKRPRAPLR